MPKKYKYIELGIHQNLSDSLFITFKELNKTKRQVLSTELMNELGDFFRLFNKEVIPQKLFKKIYIHGFQNNFACGANIKELKELAEKISHNKNSMEAYLFSKSGQNVLLQIHNCPATVTAMIHGYALGGGLELAMACHQRKSSANAVLGLPEVTLGVIPGWGGTQWPVKFIDRDQFFDYTRKGKCFTAQKGAEIGLIDSLIDQRTSLAIPKEKNYSKHSMKLINNLKNIDNSLINEMLNAEARSFSDALTHPDALEGITAFLEKREAKFQE